MQFVGALQFARHQFVGAFVVLGNAPSASFSLGNCLLHAHTANVTVSCTRSSSSVASYIGALDTAISVAVAVQVVRVDT